MRSIRLLRIPALVILSSVFLAACGGGDTKPEVFNVTASASAGGTISPATQQVEAGKTADFTINAATGYRVVSVTGCGGTLNGGTYRTGAVNASCGVTASFTINTYTVSVNSASGGQVTPTSIDVEHGQTTRFNVVPDDGYMLSSITGCNGTLVGNIYTTGAIAQACAVTPIFEPMMTLTVLTFGEGIISDVGANLNCAQTECKTSMRAGSQVQLTAAPQQGWKFSHWQGCDSVSAGVCAVTLATDRSLYPVFVRDMDPVLKPNVLLVDSAFVAQIQQFYDESIILSANANVSRLTVGTVLVSLQDEGFARVITNIIYLAGANTIVQTRMASLEDVIETGTLVLNKRFTSADIADVETLANATITPYASDVELAFGVNVQPTTGVAVSGDVTLTFDADWALDFSLSGINELRLINNVAVKPKLALTLSKEFSQPIAREVMQLPRIFFTPIVVGPVVFTPVLRPSVYVEVGEATVAVTFSSELAVEGRYGAHFKRSEGWRAIGNMQHSVMGSIDAELSLKAGVAINNAFLMNIYGVAGPGLSVEPYGEAEARFNPTALCGDWDTYFGLRSTALFQGRILGWRLGEVELNLFNLKLPMASGRFGAACSDPIAALPDTPFSPVVRAKYVNSMMLTWPTVMDAVDKPVAKYLVYRDAKKVAEVLNTAYIDTSLVAGQNYCYHLVAVDVAGNVSAAGPSLCTALPAAKDDIPPSVPGALVAKPLSSTSVELVWLPAQDEISEVSYLVFLNDQVVAGTAETRNVVLRLKPATEYCFNVVALDAAGNASERSNTACVSTNDSASYQVLSKCVGASYYVLNARLDLDLQYSELVSVAGNATDYNGTPMSYVITGLYESSSNVLNGRIDWAFQGSSSSRVDEFSVNLQAADTGDVTMNQVKVTGCTAQIRFIREDLDAETATVAPASLIAPDEQVTGNISTFNH